MMQLTYGTTGAAPGGTAAQAARTVPLPGASCLANPPIQEVSALPSGTSAPNTVITEHAISSST